MKTIWTCKLYEDLCIDTQSRTIGWATSKEKILEALNHFGGDDDSSRWGYAVIEEYYQGFHPYCLEAIWMKYDIKENRWFELETPCHTQLTSCFNHAIG